VIHSDHGAQFTSWAFTERARQSGLVPSMGSIGDCYDNAMIEAFWSRMQVELLDTPPPENARGARERDLRVHRDLPQPPTTSLQSRHADTDRI
jgi:transposase InsO family protein